MTTAQQVVDAALEAGLDGAAWSDEMQARCEAAGGKRRSLGYEIARVEFPDGSAISLCGPGGTWDVAFSGADCACWAAEGEHHEECPESDAGPADLHELCEQLNERSAEERAVSPAATTHRPQAAKEAANMANRDSDRDDIIDLAWDCKRDIRDAILDGETIDQIVETFVMPDGVDRTQENLEVLENEIRNVAYWALAFDTARWIDEHADAETGEIEAALLVSRFPARPELHSARAVALADALGCRAELRRLGWE